MAVSKALRYQILRRDNHTCRYCGASAPDVKLEVDHVVPETLGGTDDPSNLATACADCNGGKSATPPDAAQVAQVTEDAARWAAALKEAANVMLADVQQRWSDREAFRKAWSSWTTDQDVPLPLPEDWTESIDRFVALGLPLEIILDAIPLAMKHRMPANKRFRYLCGVAWKRVRQLQDEASSMINNAERSPLDRHADRGTGAHRRGRDEFAEQLIDLVRRAFTTERMEELRREAEADLVAVGEDPANLTTELATGMVRDLLLHRDRSNHAVFDLHSALPWEMADYLWSLVEPEGVTADQSWLRMLHHLGDWLGDPEKGRSAVKRRLSEMMTAPLVWPDELDVERPAHWDDVAS